MKLQISKTSEKILLIFAAVLLTFVGFIIFALYVPELMCVAGWVFGTLFFLGLLILWTMAYKKQPTKTIILTVIFGVLFYSAFTWLDASYYVYQLNQEWYYANPLLSYNAIHNTYDLAFKKIIMVAILSFSTLAFWLKYLNKDK